MEDAEISELDIGGGISLFGIFDGHGGFLNFIKKKFLSIIINKQVMKSLSSLKSILQKNLKKIIILRQNNTK